LIEEENIDSFMSWSKEVDFWGRWMPDPPEVYPIFLGEYGCSPSWRYIQQEYFGDERWGNPGKNCPGKVRINDSRKSDSSGKQVIKVFEG
jgi:hypothetical protein